MSIHQIIPGNISDRNAIGHKGAELAAAYERIDELTRALRGMIGFFQLISHEFDGSEDLRREYNCNHRIVAAQNALADVVAS